MLRTFSQQVSGENAMSIGHICSRNVDTAELDDSALTAAQRMHDRQVGTLIVIDKERRVLGIVTDRDLVTRVLLESRDPSVTNLWEVMSQLPRTVSEEMSVEEALVQMRSGPYRRLPVVNAEGRLAGIVSVDDVLSHIAAEFGEIRSLLRKQSPESLATA
jgi:CBS domain-containing protein